MKTAIVLKVKLEFEHDNRFSEEDVAELVYTVADALARHGALCPEEVDGYLYAEEVEVKGEVFYEVG